MPGDFIPAGPYVPEGGGGALVADAINDGTTTVAPSQNAVFDALAAKAPIASPTFTGTPAAPTAAAGTNTTQLATTGFVRGEFPRGAGSSAVGVSTSSFYVPPGRLQIGDAAAVTMVAGCMYFSEHYTPYPITISALRSRVTSSAASSLVRCLILACDSQFQPTSVIYQDTIDSTSTGLKDRTGLSIVVPAGPYLVACRAEGGAPSIVVVGQLPGPCVPTRSMMVGGESQAVSGTLKAGTGTGAVSGTPPQPDSTWDPVTGAQGSAVSMRWAA